MTSLAQQLQRLALPESNFGNVDDRSKPSLLFDERVAATFDKDTFYALGQNGFQELCSMEPSFHGLFYDTLFSEVAADIERTVQTKEFNKDLDKKLDSFLLCLSPYFLILPAQKCLEWLIYRFRIQSFNADSLMKCTLPYYGTNLFVRTVQLIDTNKNPKWKWIAESQVDGKPITKSSVITYCMKNNLFFEFLCEMALQVTKMHSTKKDAWQIRGFLNLFASTMLGVIYKSANVPERVMLQLMPVIFKGLKSGIMDFQASSLMIISQLAAKVTFDKSPLVSVLNITTKYCLPQLQKETIHTIALLCQTQENFKFNKRSFRKLLAMNSFLSNAVVLNSKDRAQKFVMTILDNLVPKLFASSDVASSCDSEDSERADSVDCPTILKDLIKETNLSKSLQNHLFRLLIQNYKKHVTNTGYDLPNVTKAVLRRMQTKYPDTFDDVISRCLESNVISTEILSQFLVVSLASAKHLIIPNASITLSSALLHPEPSIRQQALLSLTDALLKSECCDDTKDFAKNNVLRILEFDSEHSVITAAVQLIEANIDLFSDSCVAVWEKLLKVVESKWDDEAWSNTLQLCLKCFTSDLASRNYEALQNESDVMSRISLVVLRLFFEQAATAKKQERRNLCKVISDSPLVKNNNTTLKKIASETLLVEKDNKMEHFIASLVNIFASDLTTIDSLLDALLKSRNNVFYKPVLLLLLYCIIQVNSKDALFKAAEYLIGVSESLSQLNEGENSDADNFEEETPILLSKLFLKSNASLREPLFSWILLQIWHELVTRMSQYTNSKVDNEMVLLPETNDRTEAGGEIRALQSLFGHILDMLHFFSTKKNTSLILARNIVIVFLGDMFDGPASVTSFLSKFWLEHLVADWRGYAASARRTLQALYIALSLVTSGTIAPNKVNFLDLEQNSFFIPSLLLGCTSSNEQIRFVATRLLQACSALPSNPVISLVKFLDDHLEEIRLDASHCPRALAHYFQVHSARGGAKVKKLQAERNSLLRDYLNNHVVKYLGDEKRSYICVKFYEKCLLQVKNASELDILIPCAEKILEVCDSGASVLSVDHCLFITLLLQKLTVSDCEHHHTEQLYLKALKTDPQRFNHITDHAFLIPLVALHLLKAKFFASFSEETKLDVLNVLFEIKAVSYMEEMSAASAKAFKSLTVHSRHLLHHLREYGIILEQPSESQLSSIAAKRARLHKEQLVGNGSETTSWRKSVVLLEFLHHKKRVVEPQDMIDPLFSFLMNILDKKFNAENSDYITSLLLGCLLNMFERTKTLDKKTVDCIRKNIKVDLLVRCVHSTDNTQTHHQALMLLARVAQFCPEKVLHSVMSIFTFMGSTILRRDDSYSFQVISNTIQTVIPPLLQLEKQKPGIKESPVIGILRVFVDALPHIPAHRRLTVFETLLVTVGPDQYLWQTLLLMVDLHICEMTQNAPVDEPQDSTHGDVALTRKLDTTLHVLSSVCQLFSSKLQIDAITQMLLYLQNCIDISANTSQIRRSSFPLVDATKRSTNQIRRFRIVVLTLSSVIIKQIKTLAKDKEEMSKEEDAGNIQGLLERGLLYLEHVTVWSEDDSTDADEISTRYHKTLIRRINEILEKITGLLPLNKFLTLLNDLLTNQFAKERSVIHQKVIQLFHLRISHSGAKFNEDEEALLYKLSERFLNTLTEGCKSEIHEENLLHTAALGLTQIIRISCKRNPSKFVSIQPAICEVVSSVPLTDNVLSSLLICLGEVCINLKAHSIVNLAKISSCLIKLLAEKQARNSEAVLVSLLTTINKLFTCLGHFLSPHVDGFLAKLSILSYLKHRSSEKSSKHLVSKPASKRIKISKANPSTCQLVENVLSLIINKLSCRVLVPAFKAAYDKIQQEFPLATSALLSVVTRHVHTADKNDLAQHATSFMAFFMQAMDFRGRHPEMDLSDVETVEESTLDGVVSLLVKLPEAVFRPLYIKLRDWGCSDDADLAHSTTFYKCSSLMAAKLKGLFEIFAQDLITDIAAVLKTPLESNSARLEAERVQRASYALDTLKSTLVYSSANFLNQDKFEKILQPLVNQLETDLSERSLTDSYMMSHVIPSIGQLAAAARDNLTWQPLNYEILMKTRHASLNVRCYALECLQVIVEKLSDDYLQFLPETIPFLAELFEDESDLVEECCQRVVKKMEDILGEPLQKYF